MDMIDRNYCVLTRNTDLEPLYSFKDFPIFMGCSNEPAANDLRADMDWSISKDTGIIQLTKLLPLEVLYSDSHGAGTVGAIWMAHHKAFAKFLHKTNPSAVLEIGGSHGILAKEYEVYADISWSIIEPSPAPIEGSKAHFIKGFFDDKFSFPEAFDTVVHSHVFEHIYDPDQFMGHLSNFMNEGNKLVFTLPNMRVMLERKYNNCINFEHTAFLSEPYIEYLLAKHGFRLLNSEYFMEDHSIFFNTVRDSSVKMLELPFGLYENNKKLYLDYVNYHIKLIADLNQKIKLSKHPVYLFGAHIFAQYLVGFGLDANRIVCLLDNDSKKHGKRLCGTTLHVQSPKILKDIEKPLVILKAGVYNNEIRQDILNNINSTATFLE